MFSCWNYWISISINVILTDYDQGLEGSLAVELNLFQPSDSMKFIRFLSFLLLVSLSVYFISCDKSNKLDPDPPATEAHTCCSKDSGPCIFFEYEGKSFHFEDPTLKVWMDTIRGESIFLPDSVVFYERNIVIEKPLNESQDILFAIKDVKEPLEECIPLMEYFPPTYYYYENGLNYCFQPNPAQPDKVIPLCSSARISVRTKLEEGTGYTFAHDGGLEIVQCEDGRISGRFDNKFFKNGHLCKLDIR